MMSDSVLATNRGIRAGSTIMYLFVLLLLVSSAAPAWAQDHPNVLYIVVDNQPASILGAYGNPDVRTPHINRLANEGIRLTRAFAVHGMCSPTRATLLTGLLPSQHGVHDWLDDGRIDNWPDDWNAIREYRSLPYTLKNRGYQTALIGKWHLGRPRPPDDWFDYWVTFNLGHTIDFWSNEINDNTNIYRQEDQHSVEFFADKAVTYLENYDHERPFFLLVTFNGPYLNPPTNLGPARNRHYATYADSEFPSFPRHRVNDRILEQLAPPYSGWYASLARMNNDQASMANVASQNTLVDEGVGRLLAALEERQLEDDTLVVYTSDQGNFFGQHGFWGHTDNTFPASPYDTPMNVPFIARYPGTIERGQVSDLLVGQYDLMPTMLDLAGFGDVEIANSPGRSFADHLKGSELTEWADAVYMDQEATRVVRTDRYSFWKRLKGTGEHALYDVRDDPEQMNNLYGSPDHADVVSDLDTKLAMFFDTYSAVEYDLWRGGTVKGSTDWSRAFRSLYGEQWEAEARIKPAFKE
ncbi:MAG TPA: sulfatase-like hydrolase/transferase [Acidobacteriota bacterium]|nr:sulfatase-like hydrolase/transferase [Acidobacteriota bacterium]